MKTINLIFAILFSLCMMMFYSCSDDTNVITPTSSDVPDITENGTNPDELGLSNETDHLHLAGYLYTESNAAGVNSILVYKQQSNGELDHQATVQSGGNGTGTILSSQGALTFNKRSNLIFAVNAGSNSVSSFTVANNGNLTLVSTIETGGIRPVSVTSHNELLYVVNDGSDNISGFSFEQSGNLTAIPGSVQSLSSRACDPAQISFSPNGSFIYVSEKLTNKITTFPIDSKGTAGQGSSISTIGQTPFGFDFARNNLIISNATISTRSASTCASYGGVNSGNLTPVNEAVPNNQTAACWVTTTSFQRFAFVTNTGSDNISTYYIGPMGALYLVESSSAKTEDTPTDIVVADNNFYVYTINSMSHTIGGYKRKRLGGLEAIGTTPGLPEFATGLVIKRGR